MALRAGCDIWLGAKALNGKSSAGSVSVQVIHDGVKRSVKTKLLIGADGVQSQVANWFGLKGPKTVLSGFGAELSGVELDPNFVEIYLGNNVAPNFFAWVIPKSKSVKVNRVPARVGLGCVDTPYTAYYYYLLLHSHPILGPKLLGAKPIQYIGGGIPIGLVPKSYADNVMLVGDAAGQVKPTSGGGVYAGIVCGKHCAAAAVRALKSGKYSAKVLKSYQKNWLDAIGKELKRGMRLHKVYMHLRDDQLEEGFRLLGNEKIVSLISKHGDIDYPSKLAMKLFKKVPQLLMFAKPYLRSFF
jgi:flavin-dependent dehydrogenase